MQRIVTQVQVFAHQILLHHNLGTSNVFSYVYWSISLHPVLVFAASLGYCLSCYQLPVQQQVQCHCQLLVSQNRHSVEYQVHSVSHYLNNQKSYPQSLCFLFSPSVFLRTMIMSQPTGMLDLGLGSRTTLRTTLNSNLHIRANLQNCIDSFPVAH